MGTSHHGGEEEGGIPEWVFGRTSCRGDLLCHNALVRDSWSTSLKKEGEHHTVGMNGEGAGQDQAHATQKTKAPETGV